VDVQEVKGVAKIHAFHNKNTKQTILAVKLMFKIKLFFPLFT